MEEMVLFRSISNKSGYFFVLILITLPGLSGCAKVTLNNAGYYTKYPLCRVLGEGSFGCSNPKTLKNSHRVSTH